MTIAKFADWRKYAGMHPGFAQAFAALDAGRGLPVGRHAIDGDRLALLVGKDESRGRISPLESHRKYIDIQFVLAGAEEIGWRHTDGLAVSSPYDPERDIAFYHDSPVLWAPVPPEWFAIFFPEDAHAPLAGYGPIHKIVAKVAVDWPA